MSTEQMPKQLIPFIDGRSLLEIAASRLAGLVPADHQFVCTNERFREVIRASMKQFGDEQILGEPEGRDTLAAVGLPAAILQQRDPEAVIGVFTADHLIEPVEIFQQRVRVGFDLAEKNPTSLITFGIAPSYPATGYGYVRQGAAMPQFVGVHKVLAFKEKPDGPTAREYVDSGEYLWNSGMFVWRASTLLDCIKRYQPEVHEGLLKIGRAWDTADRKKVLEAVYPTLKKISVDYAVMEPASRDPQVSVATVRMSLTWLDVGGWPAYAQTVEPDHNGNRLAAKYVIAVDSKNNLVVSEDDRHLIALLGVNDLIVVRSGGATLICHSSEAEKVKQIHALAKAKTGQG
jgi:mannose-1-phosphate guanylyltransferase